MSILKKLIRTWWIEKPVDNNIPTSCVFEEFKPTIKTGSNREWIRVMSLDDFHKEAGMNITRWVEVCNSLSREKKENEKLKKALEKSKGYHQLVLACYGNNEQTERYTKEALKEIESILKDSN